jgi:hypothetical protein
MQIEIIPAYHNFPSLLSFLDLQVTDLLRIQKTPGCHLLKR